MGWLLDILKRKESISEMEQKEMDQLQKSLNELFLVFSDVSSTFSKIAAIRREGKPIPEKLKDRILYLLRNFDDLLKIAGGLTHEVIQTESQIDVPKIKLEPITFGKERPLSVSLNRLME